MSAHLKVKTTSERPNSCIISLKSPCDFRGTKESYFKESIERGSLVHISCFNGGHFSPICLHWSLMLKVDFEKAFDTLNWSFLDSTMSQMGFSHKWRKWIHSCLDSAFASILINGSPTSE
ncbi:hypothetical protein CTI12_AA358850 [Artemisia annua]|uniref:Uncharacterized protein n=1 Tax=Artemisia annua TaxID=35608 RepID=A0A2U1MNX3_ARTAN|nr:hypothetical protein CTI12_AA358850 [Artemisia annua]